MANVVKHKRGTSDPSASDLVVGEIGIRTDVGKLFTKMDNGSVAEIAGGGSDIVINTLSSSSATGGGSATFNGSAYRFTLSQPPSISAQQLLVSINGVIQKPVAGTGQPSEGFSVDGTDIILGDAPATGADFFILTFKSLGVSEPADNSVTSAKIVDGAIVNADINASASIQGTKISPDFGSQNIVTTGTLASGSHTVNGDMTLTGANYNVFWDKSDNALEFADNVKLKLGTGGDGELYHDGSHTYLKDVGTGNLRLASDSTIVIQKNTGGETIANFTPDGAVELYENGNKKFETTTSGVSITGSITGTGDLTIDTNTLHVDSSNNRVGIGTISPNRTLTVQSNGGQMSINDTDNTNGGIFCNAGNFAFYARGNSNLGDGSVGGVFTVQTHTGGGSTAERMRIDSNGQLLIGTTQSSAYGNRQLAVGDVSQSGSFIEIRTSGTGVGHLLFSRTAGASSGNYQGYIAYNQSSDHMSFHTGGGNQRARIDSDGLKFNADTAAANAISDYEEGTYTPAANSGGVGAYTDGQYTKIGNFCIVTGSINFDETGSGMAGFTLPFASAAGRSGSGVIRYSNRSTSNEITFHVNAGQASVSWYKHGGGSYTYSDASNNRFDFCITYRTT